MPSDHPTIDIEEIARAFWVAAFEIKDAPHIENVVMSGEFGKMYARVAREHLRRVREVVERMPCWCVTKNRFSSGGNVIRVVEARCQRCTEIAAIDAALATSEPKG